MVAPASLSDKAIALPNPLLAPVIRAVFHRVLARLHCSTFLSSYLAILNPTTNERSGPLAASLSCGRIFLMRQDMMPMGRSGIAQLTNRGVAGAMSGGV